MALTCAGVDHVGGRMKRNIVAILGASAQMGAAMAQALAARGFVVHAQGLGAGDYGERVVACEQVHEALVPGVVGVIDLSLYALDESQWLSVQWREGLVRARELGVRRYIYVSSCSVLWPGFEALKGGAVCDEGSFYVPKGEPGWWAWADAIYAREGEVYREVARGLSAAFVVPSMMWDLEGELGLAQVWRRLGRLPAGILPGGQSSVVGVDDVVEGAIKALARAKVGRRYVLAGERVTMLALWQRAGGAGGAGARWVEGPKLSGEVMAKGAAVFCGVKIAALWGMSLEGQWAAQELEWRAAGL